MKQYEHLSISSVAYNQGLLRGDLKKEMEN